MATDLAQEPPLGVEREAASKRILGSLRDLDGALGAKIPTDFTRLPEAHAKRVVAVEPCPHGAAAWHATLGANGPERLPIGEFFAETINGAVGVLRALLHIGAPGKVAGHQRNLAPRSLRLRKINNATVGKLSRGGRQKPFPAHPAPSSDA